MTEKSNTEELTEEEFLELVLEEQEKALAKEREERFHDSIRAAHDFECPERVVGCTHDEPRRA